MPMEQPFLVNNPLPNRVDINPASVVEKAEQAQERIRAAKKAETLVIEDCYFQCLHIENSCDLQFFNCIAENVKISGDWSIVNIKGLQITGQQPIYSDTPFLCTFEKCTILSSMGAIVIARGGLKIKKCKIKTIGVKMFSLQAECRLQVKESKLYLLEESKDIALIHFEQAGGSASLQLNKIKLVTEQSCLAKLYGCDLEKASMETKSCQIFVKQGMYLTLPKYLSREEFRFSGNVIHEKNINLAFVDKLDVLEHLLEDPAYTTRVLEICQDIVDEQPIILRGKSLSLQGLPNYERIDNKQSFDASSFLGSICVSDKGDSFLFNGNIEQVGQVKQPSTVLNVPLEIEKCQISMRDLKLDGVHNFENSEVTISDCLILGTIKLTNCTLKIVCTKFCTESGLVFNNSKIKIEDSEFLLASVVGSGSQLLLTKTKLEETSLQLTDCRSITFEASTLKFSSERTAVLKNSLLSIFACQIEGEMATHSCMVFDPNTLTSAPVQEAMDFP